MPAAPAPTKSPTATPPPIASRDTDALRLSVWDQFCEGKRPPEIAENEGIPERTVRRWIAAMRDEIYSDLPEVCATQFAAALDNLRTVIYLAWQGHNDEVELDCAYRAAALRDFKHGYTADLKSIQSNPPLQRRSSATRYLTLVLQTQREINRLLGLPAVAARAAAPLPADTPASENPAISATNPQPTAAPIPAAPAIPAPPAKNKIPATSATPAPPAKNKIPANSATSSTPSNPSTSPTSANSATPSTPAAPAASVTAGVVGAHGRAPIAATATPAALTPTTSTPAASRTPAPPAPTRTAAASRKTPAPAAAVPRSRRSRASRAPILLPKRPV